MPNRKPEGEVNLDLPAGAEEEEAREEASSEKAVLSLVTTEKILDRLYQPGEDHLKSTPSIREGSHPLSLDSY